MTAVLVGLVLFTLTTVIYADDADDEDTTFSDATVVSYQANETGGPDNQEAFGDISTTYGSGFDLTDAYTSGGATFLVDLDLSEVGVPAGWDELVKVSANDNTADYLGNQLTGGDGITVTEINDGADESFDIDVDYDVNTLEIVAGVLGVDKGDGITTVGGQLAVEPADLASTTVGAAGRNFVSLATRDDTYDQAHSTTVDNGAVIDTHPNAGTGTAWNARTIRLWEGILSDNNSGNVCEVTYALFSGSVDGTQYYWITAYTEDSGSTIIEDFAFQMGGIFHCGFDTAGQVNIYDAQGDGTYVGIDAPADVTASHVITLPDDGGTATYSAVTDGSGNLDFASYHISDLQGHEAGLTSPAVDTYIDLDGAVSYSGTGATDSVGLAIPWAGSIVGISASYLFSDIDDVATIDVYPREDGANIAAACKLTLAETGANRDGVSVTFAHGTHTFAANQTLGIYIDVIGDTSGPNSALQDLVVVVYYRYTL